MAPWRLSAPYQAAASDGALLGNATAVHLSAVYDSHGAGAYGNATATRQTTTTLQQYACSDTP